MNIGVDIKALMYGTSGIGRYILCLLDALQLLDFDNRYILFEHGDSGYTPSNPNWRRVTHRRRLPGTLWQQLVLPRLLKKYEIDVLWAPEQICPVIGVPARVKIATTVHDFTVFRYPEMMPPVSFAIKRALIPAAVGKSAALMPVSRRIADELLERYPKLKPSGAIVRVVGNAAKDWNSAAKPAKRENFLFFPGNLEPRKNLSRLVSALETVNQSGFELGLHVCGPKGWKNADLRAQMESSPIRERIKRLGYLSEPDLANQYLTCAALVYPSFYEGFGIPVIEALRLDTPVLTSKGTVMEEIAGPNAMYFDPYDVNSIAGTIIKFLKYGGPVIDQTSLDRYTWKKSAEDLLDVFEELGRRRG